MQHNGILVLAEHDNHHLKEVTRHVLNAARQLPGLITVLVLGYEIDKVVEDLQKLPYIHRILVVDAPFLQHGLAENVAALMAECGKSFAYILAGATSYGKNILPRVAALLGVAQISDITAIRSPDTFVRPIYAGNALATVQSLDPIIVMTIRSSAFLILEEGQAEAVAQTLSLSFDLKLSHFKGCQETVSKRPELSAARIVVAGGRGLQSASNFKLLEEIADKLGAAIGASRAAVDAGFVSNDYQIGQTGKIVAPDLYIAIGISGAIQHLAGMKDSKIIVAINKDADAPIFQVADYGLVGDLFEILPELSQQLHTLLE